MSPTRQNHPRYSLVARRAVRAMLCLCLLLTATSCTRDDASDEPVSWPELSRFDDLSLRADGLARTGDLAGLADMRDDLVKAGQAITPETIPSNATDPQRVETILADLKDLVDGLSSEVADEVLTAIVLGIHPVIESLMAAAGVPHVHDHGDHDHDHDHGDHDHDHDHDHGDHDHGDHDHDHDHG